MFKFIVLAEQSNEVTRLRKNNKIWKSVLKTTYYSLGLLISFIFTCSTLIQTKNEKETISDFTNKLKTKKTYEKSLAALIKKLRKSFKTTAARKVCSLIIEFFNYKGKKLNQIPENLLPVLFKISNICKIEFHPFDLVNYNLDIVISNDILSYANDQLTKAVLKKSVFLSNNLIFNGYLDLSHRDTCKFYYQNNLILSWDLQAENSDYTCDIFIDDSRRLLIDVREGYLQEAKLMIKGGKTGVEKRITLDGFYRGTWMVKAEKWRELMRNFIGQYHKELERRFKRSKVRIPHQMAINFSYKNRSQKSIEILNNAICNFIDIFDHDEVNQRVLFIDPFGNVIFSDPDFEEGEDEEKPFDQKVYAMRSFRPSTISETYFFNQKCTQDFYLWSNLTQISFSRSPNLITSHFQILNTINQSIKDFSVITFFDGFQFWGLCQKDGMIEGNFYTNYQDYSTISNKHIFKGRFSSVSKNIVYEGFFQGGLPHFRGVFYLDGEKVYSGFVQNGCPNGKGKIFYKNGGLFFSGLVEKGFPLRGVLYDLPKIYKGNFIVKNNASYKFSFRRLNLMAKSLNYEQMFKRFILNGKVYHASKGVESFNGEIFSDSQKMNGVFKIHSNVGNMYHGMIKNSKMTGFGLMSKTDGMKLIGFWTKKYFVGRIKLPKGVKLKMETITQAELDTVSRYQDVQKVIAFNESPVEVRGKFKLKRNELFLHKVGVIIFEDGSVYQGMIKNNQMEGYGKMVYSSGEEYQGTWKCNEIHGIGVFKSKGLVYKGQFTKGIWHGYGIMHYNNQVIKGEWKRGSMVFAMVDKFEKQTGTLKKEVLIFNVHQEFDNEGNARFDIRGPAEIHFTENSTYSVSKPDFTTSSKNTHRHAGSQSVTDLSSSRAKVTDSHIFSTKTNPFSTKKFSFIGEFMTLKHDKHIFKKGETIGYGYLVSGKHVVFKGVVDLDFCRLFGLKYDYDSETEIVGEFDKDLNLLGYGLKSDGICSFECKYRHGKRDGMTVECKSGRRVCIGYYEADQRHGLALFYGDGTSKDLRKYKYDAISVYYR